TGTSREPADSMSELAEAFQVLPGTRSGILSVALQERGLVISIAGSVLFAPGEVTLKPDARVYLDDVARKLQDVELPIMVEGTADREGNPNPGGYTPWDLAALRAGAVVSYFVERHGIPGSRFVTIGYGSAEAAERPPDMVTIVVLRKAQ
ncbi:MAG TPA: OmpA family protein, partial [Symbiobacteriaceae bacterium]